MPAADQIARERRLIAALQKVAAARMRLRFGGPASGDAHALLEDARPVSGPVSEEDGPASARSHDGASARATSIAAGVAIHRVLEDLNLESDPQPELARQRARLQGLVCAAGSAEEFDGGSGVAGPALWDAALERAYALLDRFAAGFLARRLWEIGPHIVARELEVWLPGSAGAPEGEGLAAPVRYIAGAIDLVYRDPSDGEWVVADYKTDRVAWRRERDEPADCDKPDSQRPGAGSTDLESRAASYTSQGAVYTRAVQQALGLDRLPRFELWFLEADVVVVPAVR